MNIKLNKPKGTDIYSIDIFNNNSTIIEDAFNAIESSFVNSVENVENSINAINAELSKKYNNYTMSNIDDSLQTGIYTYNSSSTVTGTLPTGVTAISNAFLISELDDDGNLQFLFLPTGIYYRNYTPTTTSWSSVSSSSPSPSINIIDNLNSDSVESALSANQGRILNEIKPSIYNYLGTSQTFNIDDCDNGIYLFDVNNISGGSPLPDSTPLNGKFILESYGYGNSIKVQRLNIIDTDKTYCRYGQYLTALNTFSFHSWKLLGGGENGGGEESTGSIYESFTNNTPQRPLLLGSIDNPITSSKKIDTVYISNIKIDPSNSKIDGIIIDGGVVPTT